MPPKKNHQSTILKRALEQPPAKRHLPKHWKQYLKKRPEIFHVVLRLPEAVRKDLVKWLEQEASAHHTFNSFSIQATEELLANPPKDFPDCPVSETKGFTVRWPGPLVDQTDKLVKKHGGPRKGMSRNTIILYGIEKKLYT